MQSFYLDSSALVKYYVPERGSTWIRMLIDDEEHNITISQLTVVEVAAAVEKRRRSKEISARHRVRTLAGFGMDHRQRYAIIRLCDTIVETAVDLTGHHPLRAYDAVQLATALRFAQVLQANALPPLTFVSADGALCRAADAEGIAAVNPNEHQDE